MAKSLKFVFVHGVGQTAERLMLGECATQLQLIRPSWSINNDVTEAHARAVQPGAVADPPILVRRGETQTRPVTMADAYWGDLSLVREGFFNVLWGTLVTMFGLRYFTDAVLKRHRYLRWTFVLIVRLIAVVDIPLNMFTYVYALVLLHFQSYFILDHTELNTFLPWAAAGNIYFAAGLSLVLTATAFGLLILFIWQKSRPVHDERPLLKHALISSLMISAVAAIGGSVAMAQSHDGERGAFVRAVKAVVANGDLTNFKRWTDYKDYELLPVDLSKVQLTTTVTTPPEERKLISPAGVYLSFFYLSQVAPLWIEALASVLGLSYAAFVAARRLREGRPIAGLLMSVSSVYALWFLFALILLLLVPADIATDLAIQKSFFPPAPLVHYQAYWFEVLPAGIYFASAAGIALVLLVQRRLAIRRAGRIQPSSVQPAAGSFAPLVGPRLLVPNLFVAASLLLAVVVSAFAALKLVDAIFHSHLLADPVNAFEVSMGIIAIALGLVVAVALLFGRLFRVGLKASMDVINHFTLPPSFPIRKQIADRLTSSIDHVLSMPDDPEPRENHLCIVAHSQGTIVVFDRMVDGYFAELLQSRITDLTIVTVGSPYRHIYQRYFDEDYPELNGINPHASELAALQATGRVRWINAYRIDDYVGTHIDGCAPGFPVNLPLACGGHTEYWRPDAFLQLSPYLPID